MACLPKESMKTLPLGKDFKYSDLQLGEVLKGKKHSFVVTKIYSERAVKIERIKEKV
jgi:hypothetical protein